MIGIYEVAPLVASLQYYFGGLLHFLFSVLFCFVFLFCFVLMFYVNLIVNPETRMKAIYILSFKKMKKKKRINHFKTVDVQRK